MKRIALAILIMTSGSLSQARTQGRFLGQQFMINIAAQGYDGSTDELPQKLFEAMNVPVQDSILGPGKTLQTPFKFLDFICANRTSGGYTCMLLIHPSKSAQLGLKTASLRVEGEMAQKLAAQFFPSSGEVFQNAEGTLEVKVTPNQFSIRFDEQGL
ncbi:hypothetical protein [Bdellovibrio svalbardensis]|uniref:Uncharacterized protein n=1 Tax=Bdellovibrio svalbardensis TaxID=2972972 RepID=A0ABT6DNE2_9BACT|nr:hypothetical protein [Bdellovibrio svalbardensis]MDG0816648.1 hypothetical protein [Bdellovibrio svalbardensis]